MFVCTCVGVRACVCVCVCVCVFVCSVCSLARLGPPASGVSPAACTTRWLPRGHPMARSAPTGTGTRGQSAAASRSPWPVHVHPAAPHASAHMQRLFVRHHACWTSHSRVGCRNNEAAGGSGCDGQYGVPARARKLDSQLSVAQGASVNISNLLTDPAHMDACLLACLCLHAGYLRDTAPCCFTPTPTPTPLRSGPLALAPRVLVLLRLRAWMAQA
jgi:hypothetical protein